MIPLPSRLQAHSRAMRVQKSVTNASWVGVAAMHTYIYIYIYIYEGEPSAKGNQRCGVEKYRSGNQNKRSCLLSKFREKVFPQSELAMRGPSGVGKEGPTKCFTTRPRHAVANICCYLRYLVRVALVSPAPNARSRHF